MKVAARITTLLPQVNRRRPGKPTSLGFDFFPFFSSFFLDYCSFCVPCKCQWLAGRALTRHKSPHKRSAGQKVEKKGKRERGGAESERGVRLFFVCLFSCLMVYMCMCVCKFRCSCLFLLMFDHMRGRACAHVHARHRVCIYVCICLCMCASTSVSVCVCAARESEFIRNMFLSSTLKSEALWPDRLRGIKWIRRGTTEGGREGSGGGEKGEGREIRLLEMIC